MTRSHEYDPRADEGLLVLEYAPGRVRITHGVGTEYVNLETSLELFTRVVVRFLDDRQAEGSAKAKPSGRKTRASEPGVDDL